MKNNYTRFLVLQREDMVQPVEDADKASVNFHTIIQEEVSLKY
jgi:prephenate dehydratase